MPPQPMATRRRRSSRSNGAAAAPALCEPEWSRRRRPETARAAASRGRLPPARLHVEVALARRFSLPAEAPPRHAALPSRGGHVSGGGRTSASTASRKINIPRPPRRPQADRAGGVWMSDEAARSVRRSAGDYGQLPNVLTMRSPLRSCWRHTPAASPISFAGVTCTPRRAPNADRGWTLFEIPSTPGSLPAVGSATCGPDRARFARAGTRSSSSVLWQPAGSRVAPCWRPEGGSAMQRRCSGSVSTPPADDAGDLAAPSLKRSLPGHQVWAAGWWQSGRA
jgi:hypothetical protein